MCANNIMGFRLSIAIDADYLHHLSAYNNNNKVFISGHAHKSKMYNSSKVSPNSGCSSTRMHYYKIKKTYRCCKKVYIYKYKHLNQ